MEVTKYVDNITLYCCIEDIGSLNTEHILNDKLQCVYSWLSVLKLTLNANYPK